MKTIIGILVIVLLIACIRAVRKFRKKLWKEKSRWTIYWLLPWCASFYTCSRIKIS